MPDADETPECVADYLTRVAMAQQGATLDAAICRQYLRKLGEALLRENVRCTTANVLVGTQIGLDGCLVDVAGQPPDTSTAGGYLRKHHGVRRIAYAYLGWAPEMGLGRHGSVGLRGPYLTKLWKSSGVSLTT